HRCGEPVHRRPDVPGRSQSRDHAGDRLVQEREPQCRLRQGDAVLLTQERQHPGILQDAGRSVNEIHAASSKTGPSLLTSVMSPYYAIVYFVVQFLLALLAAIVSAILAYGAIAATIIGLLGPIFIPFLVFDKLDWLFWGWLKAYLGFSFYKVVAAATM